MIPENIIQLVGFMKKTLPYPLFLRYKRDMIQGLGTDLVEVERIRESIEKHGAHFLDRLFTPKEQEYCFRYKDPVPHFGGRFAAKESISKALGTGFGEKLKWHDIEILNNLEGRPEVFFSDEANKRFSSPQILLSITHIKEIASAVAIWL
jgi:holo-[acyl-carrier protein] synthase